MELSQYIFPFLLAFVGSLLLIPVVKGIAFKYKIVDQPAKRKVHQKPIPRLGGVAIYLSFLIVVLLFFWFKKDLFGFGPFSDLDPWGPFWGMIIGGVILVLAGALDDIYDLSPGKKFFFQALAALTAIGFGAVVNFVRLPWGGFLEFDNLRYSFELFGSQFQFVVWADLISFIWLILIINVINWLDGLDGLAGGVASITALAIFILSISAGINQPLTALLAVVLLGSITGFLPYNFNPASIFMGDSGSQFLGYMLGVLAVICGGKIATAGLVLGFPILDGLWVILRRLLSGHSPFKADRKHLHHRLLDLGLHQRQVVLILYLLSIGFGLVAILTTTYNKFLAGMILLGAMIIGGVWLVYQEKSAKINMKNE